MLLCGQVNSRPLTKEEVIPKEPFRVSSPEIGRNMPLLFKCGEYNISRIPRAPDTIAGMRRKIAPHSRSRSANVTA